MAKAKPEPEFVDGPSRLRPQHSLDREISPVAGAPRAFRKVSPLERAFEQGHISERQRDIGKLYAENFEKANYTGVNILDTSRIRGSGANTSLSQERLDARGWLSKIENNLGPNDTAILRKVLGEWWEACEAIAFILGESYRRATVPRFREAMEALSNSYALVRSPPHDFVRLHPY